MIRNRILIVDDEPDLCEILDYNLSNEGYYIDCSGSAEEALELIKSNSYHLILLDVMMGGISGFKMAELMRKKMNNATPIIFITARDAENDMLTGFSLGADDYISKPFSIKEVLARVKAVINRSDNKNKPKKENALEIGDLRISFDNKKVTIINEPVVLTKTEFEILSYLAKNPGKVYKREDILRVAWPNNTYVLERTVDVHITRLRKKLGIFGNWVKNRSGYGYCFDPKEEKEE